MIKSLIAVAAALSLAASPVMAQNYVQGQIGGAFLPFYEKGHNFQVAAGHDFGDFRTDLGYTESRRKELGRTEKSYNLRGYYEPYEYKGFTPYVGVGLSHGKYNHQTGYAYELIGGVSYAVSPSYDIYVQAVNTESPDINYNEGNYSVGLRYKF